MDRLDRQQERAVRTLRSLRLGERREPTRVGERDHGQTDHFADNELAARHSERLGLARHSLSRTKDTEAEPRNGGTVP
jgi:hypothetical protein